MLPGPEQEREPISVLLARLVEDGRALVKAELALFRTDFYRRIARARTGALLLLIGAMMGQAAAVTFLVTLSFVLTPWIGRLASAALSVVLGLALAAIAIKIGIRKLIMVVEDYEDNDDDKKMPPSPLDILFERMRARSRAARDQLTSTVDETQARLHPQALIADLADEVVNHAQAMTHSAIDALRRRPVRMIAMIATALLILVRPPIFRFIGGLGRETRGGAASYKSRGDTAQDEESSS